MTFNPLGVIKKGGNQRHSPKKSGNKYFEPGKYSSEGTSRPVSKYTPYIHHTAYINSLNTGQKTRQPLPYLYKPSYLTNRLRSPSPEPRTKMVIGNCKPISGRKKDEDSCNKVASKIMKPQQHAIMKRLLSNLNIDQCHEDKNSKKISEKSKMFDVDDFIKNKSLKGKRPTVRFHPSVENSVETRAAKNKSTGKIETESEYFLRHCDGSNSQLILNPDHPNVDVIFSNESLFKHDQSKETVCSEVFYESKSNNRCRKQKNNSFGICDRNDCIHPNSLKTADSFVSKRSILSASPTYYLTDIEKNNAELTETNDSFIENSWDERFNSENNQTDASETFHKYQTFDEMKRNRNSSTKNDWEKIGIRENSLDRNIMKRNIGTVPKRPHTFRESFRKSSQNPVKENCSYRNYKSNGNTPRECINVFARLQKSEDIIKEVTRRFSNEEFEKTSCEEYTIDIKGRRSLIGSPVIHKGNHRTRVMQARKSVESSSSNEDNNTKFVFDMSKSLGSKSNENNKIIKMQNRKYSRRNIERKNSNISTGSSTVFNSAPPSPNLVKKRNNIRQIGLLDSSTNRQFVNEYPLRYYNNPEPKLRSNQDRDDWQTSGNEEENDFARVKTLPKETKTAMLILMEEKKTNSQTRSKKILHSTETQTSPLIRRKSTVISINILSDSSPENSKIRIDSKENLTCPYDLLCNRCTCTHMEKSLDQSYSRQDRVHPKKRRANSLMRTINESSCISWIDNMEETTMNGMNGHHTNGELNGCGGDIITQNQQKGCWTIGLINSASQRYLTAETFGYKINANGVSLKKKQIWTLEPINGGTESFIYLRSHLEKYLAVDSFGNVTCESDEKDPGTKFQISVSEDGTGRWALRNVTRGYFLGSSADKLTCTAKVPGNGEFWHVHLAARPQINLRSVGRKRFAHLSENLDEIHVDANIPWGEDTLFTLEFRFDESGKYAIHTCNNKYLSRDGKLSDTCTKNCLFSAEYHSGQLALRDCSGAYLSPIGSKAVLKTRSQTVTKDELFSLEDSLPQASFVAALNSRYVSVKQGVDVTANQDEISDHETFQLEFDWSTKRWYIRTMQDRYWTLETGGGIQAAGDKRSSNALFDLIWQGDGSVCFRANNGKYVMTKRSGHLYATAEAAEENCKYFFYLINRPILVLKCEQGFVGYKSASSPKLECNKATYETIQVERSDKGVVFFKGQNGKYWHVDGEGVTADSDTPEGFYLELREPTRICIKSVSGQYLAASKNGMFRLGDSNIESATQWEY